MKVREIMNLNRTLRRLAKKLNLNMEDLELLRDRATLLKLQAERGPRPESDGTTIH